MHDSPHGSLQYAPQLSNWTTLCSPLFISKQFPIWINCQGHLAGNQRGTEDVLYSFLVWSSWELVWTGKLETYASSGIFQKSRFVQEKLKYAVTKCMDFWVAMTCSSGTARSFKGTNYLSLQGRRVGQGRSEKKQEASKGLVCRQILMPSCLSSSSTLKGVAICSSETTYSSEVVTPQKTVLFVTAVKNTNVITCILAYPEKILLVDCLRNVTMLFLLHKLLGWLGW
jgi:hypothetical protein